MRTDINDRFIKVANISHIQKLNNVGCEETIPETSRSKLESKKPNASKTFFATITKEIITGGGGAEKVSEMLAIFFILD
jgi:hypothetical protein